MPLLCSSWDAAPEAASERAGAIDDGRRVGYEAPQELGPMLEECGLAGGPTSELLADAGCERIDELWRPFAAGIGHAGTCLVSLDGAGQASLAADVHRRLGSPAGSFTLTARGWSARATAR